MTVSTSAIEELSVKLAKEWPAISAARTAAATEVDRIESILADHRLIPSDTSLVVFGSLARREWTFGSDVDWTLLIDGQADPNHLKVKQEIANRFLQARLQGPGPTATFGGLAFSHDLIHQIGGEEDTNRNTPRRILLILESLAVGNSDAYDRVIKSVLNRYLDDDLSFLSRSGQHYKVPRFLLNDIVRYWRTMCVDYATKHRERQGEKWALKNAKLRLSRKLIFAAGLLTCFNCHLRPPAGLDENLFDLPAHLEPLLRHLRTYVKLTPLEIVADAANSFAKPETSLKIFDAYDQFLSMMNDGEVRTRLESLTARECRSDPVFNKVRHISEQFQDGLTRLFLDDEPKLSELTRKYGVF
jgi:predicted nucleotidyltransferase